MIISHRFRFIFIKTLKTAGTSLEVYLSDWCGPDDVLTPILPPVAPHQARNHGGFYNHMPAAEVRQRLPPEIWETYFKFCVERNPWDKTLSYFHMMNARAGGRLNLAQFLQGDDLPLNYPKYTDPADPTRIIVNRVVRYEHLNTELAEIFARLGIPFPGQLNVWAKSEYRTDRRPYQEVYTREQRERIRKIFAPEIRLFGYQFDADTATW